MRSSPGWGVLRSRGVKVLAQAHWESCNPGPSPRPLGSSGLRVQLLFPTSSLGLSSPGCNGGRWQSPTRKRTGLKEAAAASGLQEAPVTGARCPGPGSLVPGVRCLPGWSHSGKGWETGEPLTPRGIMHPPPGPPCQADPQRQSTLTGLPCGLGTSCLLRGGPSRTPAGGADTDRCLPGSRGDQQGPRELATCLGKPGGVPSGPSSSVLQIACPRGGGRASDGSQGPPLTRYLLHARCCAGQACAFLPHVAPAFPDQETEAQRMERLPEVTGEEARSRLRRPC